ncbi:DUF4238 domain-containing protein [Vibrio cholerae]|nr:DUF4238 domain-containing protein [Vibrio cholerae]EKF9764004.1 DUF4238 domain-containing protein [Vibrio cholerae]OYP05460.1 hypothetical protein CI599_03555 [Vibrio cholerae]
MAEKKKQHYIPRFYLKNFAVMPDFENREPYVFVHSGRAVKHKSPSNTGYINYFYRIELGNIDRNYVEDLYSKIESDTKPVIQRVLSLGLDMLSENERYILARFISFLFTRTPKIRDLSHIALSNSLKAYVSNKVSLERMSKKFDIPYSPATGNLNSTLELPKETIMGVTLAAAIRYLPMFADRNWFLLYTEDLPFVTSDHPVVLYNPDIDHKKVLPGLAFSKTDFYFPLNSHICLYGSYSTIHNSKCSNEQVCFINSLLNDQKTDLIFASCDMTGKL